MKKIAIMGIIAIMVLVSFTPDVFGGDTDTIDVTLNPQTEASIIVNQSSWTPSASLGGESQTSGDWALLTNDGDVQVDVVVNATNTTNWILSTSSSHNVFTLDWLLQGTTQKYEYQTSYSSWHNAIWGNYWKAMTFTVGTVGINEDFYASYIKFRVAFKTGSPSNIIAHLRATSSGVPTNTDLTSGSVPSIGTGWQTITFSSPYKLTAGTKYALCISCTGSVSAYIGWSDVTSGYSAGSIYDSSSGGSSWSEDTNDAAFEIWGYNSTYNSITTIPVTFVSDLFPVSGTQEFGLAVKMPTTSSTNTNQTSIITFKATAD